MRIRTLAVLVVLAVPLAPRAARAACAPVASPDALCAAPGTNPCTSIVPDPCYIAGMECPIVAGTTLDFGTRNVVLCKGTRLDVGSGTMTVKAGSLRLDPGTGLLGAGGAVLVNTTGDIAVLRSGTTRARIDVTDPVAGDRLELFSSAGTIRIDGVLDARGTNTDGSGGSIDLRAGSILIAGDVLTSGGHVGVGGPVSIQADGTIVVSGTIDGAGGSGGEGTLESGGSTTLTGTVDLRAVAAGGEGGVLTVLTTDGSVTLGGKIYLQGDEGTDDAGGGNGGQLNVFAGGGLTLAATIELSGAPPDGQGGEAFFLSALDTTQTPNGVIMAQGRGAESDGGSLDYESHRTVTLGPIDVHGGENLAFSGGAVQATAWCDLIVPSGITITAEGDKGQTVLQAGRQIAVAGALKAGTLNLLEYLTLLPITAGGIFLPELEMQQSPSLTPCGGFAPPGCGNNAPEPGEECDDGNTAPCDGCSSVCTIEACGNGTVDCSESCDDGNMASCDGCTDDCARSDDVCGDGIVECGEGDDDGNLVACDGVSASCHTEGCGNGTVECGEECDPPDGASGCTPQCVLIPPGCGNGQTVAPEECDDGNTADADGCSHQCRFEVCGNGKVDPGEDCDDFNMVGCDGCSLSCHFEACGNGFLDCGEECDDGAQNGAPGGSCLPEVCRPGQFCTPDTADRCIPCAVTTDCDPLGACGPAACEVGVCTPVSPPNCSDDDACNGTETCDPAVGCKAGPTPSCDDGDACTDGACDPVLACVNTLRTGFDLATCRLDAARAIVTAASASEIGTPIRTKLLKRFGGVEAKLLAAKAAPTKPQKQRKALRAAQGRIRALVKLVTKQRGKTIAAPTAQAILDALGVLPPIVDGLVP